MTTPQKTQDRLFLSFFASSKEYHPLPPLPPPPFFARRNAGGGTGVGRSPSDVCLLGFPPPSYLRPLPVTFVRFVPAFLFPCGACRFREFLRGCPGTPFRLSSMMMSVPQGVGTPHLCTVVFVIPNSRSALIESLNKRHNFSTETLCSRVHLIMISSTLCHGSHRLSVNS